MRMAGLDQLIEKIMIDAKAKAAEIDAASAAESAGIIAGYEGKAKDEKAAFFSKANADAASRKTQLVSSAELAVRDKKLAAKQQLIEKVLDAALQRLRDMDDLSYAAFLSKQLSGANLPEGTEILVPQRYRNTIDLNAVHPHLRLAQEDREISGGFVLVAADSESNSTYEALIGHHRNELEKMIADRLFV